MSLAAEVLTDITVRLCAEKRQERLRENRWRHQEKQAVTCNNQRTDTVCELVMYDRLKSFI